MDDVIVRFVDNIIERASGPMHVRLVLQPLMATLLALRAGIRDARAGRPPYLWAILASPRHRYFLLHEGWKDVGTVFCLAVGLDVVYQWITIRWVYPVETIVIACLLAFIPYLVFRGAFNRLAHLAGAGESHPRHEPS